MAAPSYRKGELAAALAELRKAPGAPDPEDAPIVAATPAEYAAAVRAKAWRRLEAALNDYDPRTRLEAARVAIIQGGRAGAQPQDEAPLTRDERVAHLRASLREPDAELAEALEAEGYRRTT